MQQLIRFISRHLPLAIKLLRIHLNIVFLLVMWLPFNRTPNMYLHHGLEEGWGNRYLYDNYDWTT